ncbi:MAG: helix-turn-helix domain-containing protein, partial [Thermoplasmata archaeon]
MCSQKLTERKIRYIINSRKRGSGIKQIAMDLKISQSTVKRVWRYYLDTGEKLIIKDGGRKMKEINPDEEKIVIQAFMIHKMGARRLEKIIENDLGIHIPHNTIHR